MNLRPETVKLQEENKGGNVAKTLAKCFGKDPKSQAVAVKICNRSCSRKKYVADRSSGVSPIREMYIKPL